VRCILVRTKIKGLQNKPKEFDPLKYPFLLLLSHDEEEYFIAVSSAQEQDAWVAQFEGLRNSVQSLYWSKISTPGKPEPSARFNHSFVAVFPPFFFSMVKYLTCVAWVEIG
jgi:hypothetical protein